MFFFVNRRLVRDKILLHAISEAYRSVLPSGTFPVTILFITIPFEDVDVNVHPAKTEIRFKHQSFIHDAIRDSILSGLTSDKTIVAMEASSTPDSPFRAPEPQARVPESWSAGESAHERSICPADASGEPAGVRTSAASGLQRRCAPPAPDAAYADFGRVMREVHPLGQLRDSFIIATDSSWSDSHRSARRARASSV